MKEVNYKSDLTHKKIANEGEHAYLIVHRHPAIQEPKKLDAHALEAVSLKDKVVGVARVEVILPDGDTQMLDIPVDSFNALFGKDIAAEDVLGNADSAYAEDEPAKPRRGRPAGSTNKPAGTRKVAGGSGKSPEELAAVRSWLTAQGIAVNSRGRIKSELLAQYDEAHKG